MWNGKLKAVTFSYDDAVTQDIRFIELLDKYSLKCTFNLNSELLGRPGELIREEVRVDHNKIRSEDIKEVYKNHEVAAHTLTHPFLPGMDDDNEIIRQVEQDRLNLEKLVGYKVQGFAYPGGGKNYDSRVAALIKEKTNIKYARTPESTFSFDLPENYYELNPTVYHHRYFDEMFELGKKFIELKPEKPQLFYIFGHAYEFDIHNTWDKMEEFMKLISGRDDIFYGTNSEVLL